MKQIIHLSSKGKILCMTSALLLSLLMLCLPLAVTLIIRSYCSEVWEFYVRHPILPMVFSFLPIGVLQCRNFLIRICGKIGFCITLELSMTVLITGFSSQLDNLFVYQWLWTIPLMLVTTISGFMMKRILLPHSIKFFFFGLVGFAALADFIISITCNVHAGVILCIGIALLFVFLQFSHARILQGRLEQETFSDIELTNLLLNYALIFSINLTGMLLTAHPMKICLAFMFDNLAAGTITKPSTFRNR